MVELLDLPDEILVEILDYVYDNIKGRLYLWRVRNVSLVCRHLRSLALPLIIRDMSAYYGDGDPVPHAAFLDQCLDERPERAGMIRTLTIYWDQPAYRVKADALLSKLYALRELDLSIVEKHVTSTYIPEFPNNNELRFLESLVLNHYGMTPAALVRYMSIRSLRKLEIQSKPSTSLPFPRDLPTRFSQIKELDICGRYCLPPEWLFGILNLTNSLEVLVCTYPGNNIPVHPLSDPQSDFDCVLSPAAIVLALSPVLESLKELRLLDHNVIWAQDDASRLDLSHAKQLKILQCPAYCVFPRSMAYHARVGLIALLPPNIETLMVNFEENHFFLPPQPVTEPANEGSHVQTVNNSALSWLVELLVNCKDFTPGLAHVWIYEWEKVDYDQWEGDSMVEVEVLWLPPCHIAEMALKAGVKLEIFTA